MVKQHLFSFVIIVIFSVEYLTESNGYRIISSPYTNLSRSKRLTGGCKRQYGCDNGQCIPIHKYCDGKSDCSDNSDETLFCSELKCPSNKFQCAYGACVSKSAKCDGKQDCSDNSDENMCDNLKLEHCAPPVINNGDYKIIGKTEYVTGTPIPNHSVIDFFCLGQNYILSENYSTVVCINGQLSREPPKCIFVVSCPAAFNYATDVNCTLNEEQVDCTSKNIPVGTIASMKCKPNFVDETPEISNATCSANGTWDAPLKECTSPYMCPPRPSITINVSCEWHDFEQDCSREVPEGTVARMYCKHNYIDVSDGPTTAMCLNGTWTAPLKNCTPDCNYIIGEAQPLIVSGTPTKRGDFPWHVGIYRHEEKKNSFTYLCGGSIISVKVVLSAAHCFYDEIKGEMNPVFEYSVAAGKLYSEWNAKEDDNYVQERQVTQVYIKTSYLGNTNRYEADIAVVAVDKLFIFSDLVHAVCVDWNLELTQQQLQDGALGKVAGWGLTSIENIAASTNLNQLKIPFVDRETCLKIVPRSFKQYLTLDKFCAGYRNGSSLCKGDSGGGLVFKSARHNQSNYYLQGIVSTGPTFYNGSCNNNEVGVYTKVSDFISFIATHEEINRGAEFCLIPSIPNAEVVIKSTDNEIISDKLVRNSTQIAIYCNEGYTLVGDKTATCLSGQWNITMVKCVGDNDESILRPCRAPFIKNGFYVCLGNRNYIHGNPIRSLDYIQITCNENFSLEGFNSFMCYNGEFDGRIPTCDANCEPMNITGHEVEYVKEDQYVEPDDIRHGTIALVKCSKHYTGLGSNIATSTCKDGSWDRYIDNCVAECGVVIPEKATLIFNGTAAEKLKFPWHVAIYSQKPDEPIKFICGSTLVSDQDFLIAAHCLPEDAKDLKSDALSEFSIVAGKYFSDWDAPEDTDFVQKRKISRVLCFPYGRYTSHRCTTGILEIHVDTPFTITDLVKPVCIDMHSMQFDEFKSGSKAQVAGWSAAPTKNATRSVALQQFTVTYFDREQCSQMLQQNFQEFLTNKTFCATYTNESSACNEDSGTGFFYPRVENGTEKYYIGGIKTLHKSGSCYNREIGIYTAL